LAVKAHVWEPWIPAYAEPERLAVVPDSGSATTCRRLIGGADRIGHVLLRMGLSGDARLSILLAAGPQFRATREFEISRRRAGLADETRVEAI